MKRLIWKSGVTLIAGGALLFATAGTTLAAGSSEVNRTVVHKAAVSSTQQQNVAKYWTPQRMTSAVPIERLMRVKAPKQASVKAGKPVVVQPQAFPHGGGVWTGGGAVVKTAGRVFFTFNGQNSSCSGNAVTSGNKSTVITAGHCVKYQGSWHTNWAFIPAYDTGNRPYGTWTAKRTLTTPQWNASEDLNYDVGAAVVNPLNGASLTDVVGSQGIAFNQARGQRMYSFGYSAAAPYDGTKLIYCSGTVFNDFLLSSDLGMTCNQTGGSSGGPWFLTFSEANGTGILNSVNSFKYNFFPNWMFGPYFGNDARNLYNTAQAA